MCNDYHNREAPRASNIDSENRLTPVGLEVVKNTSENTKINQYTIGYFDTIDNKRIWRKYKRKEHTRDYWEQLRWCGKEGGLYANIVEASRAIFVRLTEIKLICQVIDKILFHGTTRGVRE